MVLTKNFSALVEKLEGAEEGRTGWRWILLNPAPLVPNVSFLTKMNDAFTSQSMKEESI